MHLTWYLLLLATAITQPTPAFGAPLPQDKTYSKRDLAHRSTRNFDVQNAPSSFVVRPERREEPQFEVHKILPRAELQHVNPPQRLVGRDARPMAPSQRIKELQRQLTDPNLNSVSKPKPEAKFERPPGRRVQTMSNLLTGAGVKSSRAKGGPPRAKPDVGEETVKTSKKAPSVLLPSPPERGWRPLNTHWEEAPPLENRIETWKNKAKFDYHPAGKITVKEWQAGRDMK